MSDSASLLLRTPAVVPPLDPGFRPISTGSRNYLKAVRASGKGTPLAIAIERNDGLTSVHNTEVFEPGPVHQADTNAFVERLVKFLLWQIGGWKVTLCGPRELADHIATVYSRNGSRAFDVNLMETVYEKPFTVAHASFDQAPLAKEAAVSVGGHLDGCRIGFDLGASDYKLSAVKDGEPVFTTEIPWDPKVEPNPDWHYQKINEGLKLAASKLPRVDAIGGSSAGIIVDNRIRAASLFRAVPAKDFAERGTDIFLRLQQEWGVPFEAANDGDVTALAGAMSLNATGVLGIAMGSSEAAGFLDNDGRIRGWLNELAFAPVDYSATAAVDEWSGDRGVGALYFSQQAVVKLAPVAGISLPDGHMAEQLRHVQELHKAGDERAVKIFETIGIYLGYALAQYADMYDFRHVLVLGRVTSGAGGDLILAGARKVLETEFPDLVGRIAIHTPDEKNKRHGQAVAAASLPKIAK